MTKIKSDAMFQVDGFNAYSYIAENFGSLAYMNNNNEIVVKGTDENSGWGNHTSKENAEYIMGIIKEDGFTDIVRV